MTRVCMIVYTLYDTDARVRREAETLVATGQYDVHVLTFSIGLACNFLFNDLSSAVELWIANPDPVLEEPCAFALTRPPAPIPPVGNCSLLVLADAC